MNQNFKKNKTNTNCHCEGTARGNLSRDCFTSFAMTEQTGRSMVEMLGVLAVIGVLSVAGIAGYSNSMKQYRSNEILNATSTLYVMGMAQNAGNGTDMNYTSIGTAPNGTSELAYNNTTKAITITFTDAELCPLVKNKLGDKAGECNEGSLTVNFGGTSSSSSGENNSQNEQPEEQETITCPDNTTTCPSDKVCCPTIRLYSRTVSDYTCQEETNCSTHSESACEASCTGTCITTCDCDENGSLGLGSGYYCSIGRPAGCFLCPS